MNRSIAYDERCFPAAGGGIPCGNEV